MRRSWDRHPPTLQRLAVQSSWSPETAYWLIRSLSMSISEIGLQKQRSAGKASFGLLAPHLSPPSSLARDDSSGCNMREDE